MAPIDVFSLCVAVLCLEAALIGPMTVLTRLRRKVWLNAEDAARFGGEVSEVEHADVARWLRIHRNHLENCVPFFALGALWVALDLWPSIATWSFAAFTVARVVYPVAYAARLGHARTAIFAIGWTAQLVLVGGLLWRALG